MSGKQDKSGIFKTLKREKLSDQVVEQIKILIAQNKISPGERLPSERKLCTYFEVGRPTIREALQKLSNIGLIEIRAGDGTYVKEADVKTYVESVIESIDMLAITDSTSYEELWQVRNIFEVSIAGMAAENATDKDIKYMKDILDDAKERLNSNQKYSEEALKFHSMLAQSTDNQLIIFIFDSLKKMLKKYFKHILQKPKASIESFEFHEEIFLAVKEGNPSKARDAMHRHLQVVHDNTSNNNK
ncbi:MAG: FadR/GntR family transcriptional regulator [Halothermotrichaceae bacterium]